MTRPESSPTFDCVLGAWQAHEAELLGFLRRQLSDEASAEDMLQEVLLRAMQQGAGFCRIESPRAWLYRVARNAVTDSRRTTRLFQELPEGLMATEAPEPPQVLALEACLARNLTRLAPHDQAIISACDLGQRTVREFASEAGLTVAAAKARLLRARRRLRDALVEHCRVEFDEAGSVCCFHPPAKGASFSE